MIPYLSVIQENYSTKYILTLQDNETAIEKLTFYLANFRTYESN